MAPRSCCCSWQTRRIGGMGEEGDAGLGLVDLATHPLPTLQRFRNTDRSQRRTSCHINSLNHHGNKSDHGAFVFGGSGDRRRRRSQPLSFPDPSTHTLTFTISLVCFLIASTTPHLALAQDPTLLSAEALVTTGNTDDMPYTIMMLTGTDFPEMSSQMIAINTQSPSTDELIDCTDVKYISSTKLKCRYPAKSSTVGCTRQTVTLSFDGINAADKDDKNMLCFVNKFVYEKNPSWLTISAYNIIIMSVAGLVALLIVWLCVRNLGACVVDCCRKPLKYKPESATRVNPRYSPVLHRMATCEKTIATLKLADAACPVENPTERSMNLQSPSTVRSQLAEKAWSMDDPPTPPLNNSGDMV